MIALKFIVGKVPESLVQQRIAKTLTLEYISSFRPAQCGYPLDLFRLIQLRICGPNPTLDYVGKVKASSEISEQG